MIVSIKMSKGETNDDCDHENQKNDDCNYENEQNCRKIQNFVHLNEKNDAYDDESLKK